MLRFDRHDELAREILTFSKVFKNQNKQQFINPPKAFKNSNSMNLF